MTMSEYEQQDTRTWAMVCHLASFAGYVVPFGNIIGPLVVWMVKKDTSTFVDEHGKEALNFQISLTIYVVVAAMLAFVLIGFVILPALLILDIVVTIIADIEANKCNLYRYTLTIRFVS